MCLTLTPSYCTFAASITECRQLDTAVRWIVFVCGATIRRGYVVEEFMTCVVMFKKSAKWCASMKPYKNGKAPLAYSTCARKMHNWLIFAGSANVSIPARVGICIFWNGMYQLQGQMLVFAYVLWYQDWNISWQLDIFQEWNDGLHFSFLHTAVADYFTNELLFKRIFPLSLVL